MAIGVIVQLKIVQINDGHAAAGRRILNMQLIIITVVRARQRIVVPLVVHILAGEQEQLVTDALHMDRIPLLFRPVIAEAELKIKSFLPLAEPLPHISLIDPRSEHIRGIRTLKARPHILHRQPSPSILRLAGIVVDKKTLVFPVVFRDQIAIVLQRFDRPVLCLHGSFPQLPTPAALFRCHTDNKQ